MIDLADDSIDELMRRVARTSHVERAPRKLLPGTQLAERFDVGERLGEGGMGQVFSAFDRVRGTDVALKVLGRMTPRSILQVKREFRAAAGLVHPNLIRLHELFVDGVEWFFTMKLVRGAPLFDLGLDARSEELRDIFRQLAAGLRALHRAGTIHADLKPSNFLVTHADRRVVLLDFGLARPIGLADASHGGTPLYMSPEQELGYPLTDATDWYSFGLVLKETLSGRLPDGAAANEDGGPHDGGTEARGLADAPTDLQDLCRRLLHRNPEERAGAADVEAVLGSEPTRSWLDARAAPRATELFGRDRETAELERALEASRSGRPSTVLVHGTSGIGKTALVQTFVDAVRRRGGLALTGACRERESMSYKAVDGLIDGVVSLLDDLPRGEAVALLPRDLADLTVLFPALRTAAIVGQTPPASTEGLELGAVRHRAVGAFVELLGNLRRRAELVVWVDDLQWADAESARLLRPLLTGNVAVPLLFIGGHRSGPAGKGPLLDALLSDLPVECRQADIPLGPLDLEESARLALACLAANAPSSDAAAREIGRDSGGHPLFIAELAHGRGEHRGTGVPDPASLFALVTARIAALPADARSMVEATAVAGMPISRSILREIQGLNVAPTEEALDVLKATRLAISRGFKDDDAIDIQHDRIRDIILDGLGAEVRREHHARLAAALGKRAETTPEIIATHHHAAGERVLAARHWLKAAERAVGALAFDYAVELYDKGLADTDATRAERRAIEVRRAAALADAGRGPLAAEAYLHAAADSPSDERVELTRRAADQYLRAGHISRGLTVIEEVLRAIGMRRTRGGWRALASFLVGRAQLRVRGLKYVTRPESALSGDELARLDASWTIACSFSVIDPFRGADFQTQHLRMALDAGEPRRLLRALSLEIPYSATTGVGNKEHTRMLLVMAEQLRRDVNEPGPDSLFFLSRGVSEYLHGDFAACLRDLEESLALMAKHCPGAIWETVTAQRFVIAALFQLGHMRQLAERVPKLLEQSDGQGNLYATMSFRAAYSWAAWLAMDDVTHARDQIAQANKDWAGPSYHNSHCNILIGESYVDLYDGEADRAHERLCEQWPKVRGAQLFRVSALRAALLLLRGGSAVAAANLAEHAGRTAKARALRADAHRAVRLLSKDPLARASVFAQSIQAALDASDGKHAAACLALRASIEGFELHGMRLFAAAARVRLADLLDGDESSALRAHGSRMLSDEAVVDPVRMVNMLVPGF